MEFRVPERVLLAPAGSSRRACYWNGTTRVSTSGRSPVNKLACRTILNCRKRLPLATSGEDDHAVGDVPVAVAAPRYITCTLVPTGSDSATIGAP
jgi:hypothetical protein